MSSEAVALLFISRSQAIMTSHPFFFNTSWLALSLALFFAIFAMQTIAGVTGIPKYLPDAISAKVCLGSLLPALR